MQIKLNSHTVTKTAILVLVAGVWVVPILAWIAGWTVPDLVAGFQVVISLATAAQALLFLYWTLYAWNDPELVEQNRSPNTFTAPQFSFTALLPVRHEEKVIGDTIRAIATIAYPTEMKELLVLVRGDDLGTIEAANKAIETTGEANIRLVVVNDMPVNKPNQLNWGLREAQNDIVVVFDAEDQPHRDIYQIVNTVMLREKADVVQSGVQLMNFRSSWFSALNVLEYFFWFKSALHFFASQGVVPLGGNTVFFKRHWLMQVGGWDEQCLTEDADIGFRLSQAGARIRIVYDERHATQEETPDSLKSFVKQRTRWHQGFLQIFAKGEWRKFPTLKQRLLAGYMLLLPQLVAVMMLLIPVSFVLALAWKLPVPVVMISYLPLGLFILQFVIITLGMWMFTRDYKKHFPPVLVLQLMLGFIPFVLALGIAAVRATNRFWKGNTNWEKTNHINAHRIKPVTETLH